MKWISVQNQMPPLEKRILVYCLDRYCAIYIAELKKRSYRIPFSREWEERLGFDDSESGRTIEQVTHWMWLPDHPIDGKRIIHNCAESCEENQSEDLE